MANYIFLMSLQNTTSPHESEANDAALVKLTIAGCGFSFVGNMLTLCLLCFLPISSDSMFILINMCIAMITAQLSFIGAENSYPDAAICKAATAVIQYLFLVVNFTSLCFGLHLLSKLFVQLLNRAVRRVWVVAVCWGFPLAIVGVTLVVRGDLFGRTTICWLPLEKGTRWAFLGPVLAIQIINWIVFFTILSTRFRMDNNKALPFLEVVRHQISTACSLIPTLGLTWTLGLGVAASNGRFLQYLFVIFTAIQVPLSFLFLLIFGLCSSYLAKGMLIFLGHILPNKNIRSSLCNKMRPSDIDVSCTDEISEDFTQTSAVYDASQSKRGSMSTQSRRRSSAVSNDCPNLLVPPDAQCRHRVPRHST